PVLSKHAGDFARPTRTVELGCSREAMLSLVAVGQRQPAALGGQEVSLELLIDGAVGLLVCQPGAFVAVADLRGQVLEHGGSLLQAGAHSSLSLHRPWRY